MQETDEQSHNLSYYLRIVGRRIWIVVASVVAAVVVAGVLSLGTKVYRSTTTLGWQLPTKVSTAAQPTAQTLADLVDSYQVASTVVQSLNLPMAPDTVLAHLNVVTKQDQTILQLQYDDSQRTQATQIVQSVATTFTKLANQLFAREYEAIPVKTRQGYQPVTVSVLHSAQSVGKVAPKPARNIAVAGVLGLLLGIVAAFVLEQFDDTVRGTEQAAEAFGMEAVATLPPHFLGHRPFDPRRRRKLDPVLAELTVQRLAANVLLTPESRQTKTVLVTSANPEEGKTTVTANLAVELASAGHKVIVVEADLRRPMLYDYLGLSSSSSALGLDAVIQGRATVTAAMIDIPVWDRTHPSPDGDPSAPAARDAHSRLRAILAPPGATWPSEFGTERMQEVLQALASRADYVLIDAPPTLIVPDVYPLVSAVDLVIAVVRSGKATSTATTALSRLLQRLRARRVELVVTESEEPYESAYHAYYTAPKLAPSRQVEPEAGGGRASPPQGNGQVEGAISLGEDAGAAKGSPGAAGSSDRLPVEGLEPTSTGEGPQAIDRTGAEPRDGGRAKQPPELWGTQS